MSSTLAPFGLRPLFHVSGQARPTRFVFPDTSSTYLTAGNKIAQNAPVTFTSTGGIALAASTTGTGSSTNTYGIAVFDGAEFTDSQGQRRVTKYFDVTAQAGATDIWFWVFNDANQIYEIQFDGQLSATLATAAGALDKVYQLSNSTATVPASPAVGFAGVTSGATLSAAAGNKPASTSIGDVRVVGLSNDVGLNLPSSSTPGGQNNWNDPYPVVQVQIANPANFGAKAQV